MTSMVSLNVGKMHVVKKQKIAFLWLVHKPFDSPKWWFTHLLLFLSQWSTEDNDIKTVPTTIGLMTNLVFLQLSKRHVAKKRMIVILWLVHWPLEGWSSHLLIFLFGWSTGENDIKAIPSEIGLLTQLTRLDTSKTHVANKQMTAYLLNYSHIFQFSTLMFNRCPKKYWIPERPNWGDKSL